MPKAGSNKRLMSELVGQIDGTSRAHDGLSTLNRPARIKVIKEQFGFYPQNNDELSRIIALVGRSLQANPVLTHFDEVYKHQRSAHADAPAALRSMVRLFESYAGNALDERLYMEAFLDFVSQARPNQFSGFTTVFPTESWENDGTMRATFTAVARYIETEHFAETEEGDSLAKDNLIDELSGPDRVSHIVQTLGALRVSSLERTAKAIQVSQEKRFAFWVDKLELSRAHFFARDVAAVALNNLEKISK